MSSVVTEKSTLTSSYNSSSLYSNWSPYVSPSEFSTTAPLQLPLQPPPPPPPYSYSPSSAFPNRKQLMFKYSVQYKIPHAKLESECQRSTKDISQVGLEEPPQ